MTETLKHASPTVPSNEVFPVLRENILVDGFHLVIDLEKSQGSIMVDALEGKEYLDCYSYFASLPIGHNHPKMEDPTFREALTRVALTNPANSDIYTQEFAGFVKTFREVAVPDEFRYLFFVAGGSLAVENAMKTAFDWKCQKNRAAGVEGGGDKILHFREAFHGRSGYTLSVTNTDPGKTRDFPQFEWPRVSNPKLTFPIDEVAMAAAEAESVREIEAAFAADPHGIAGILLEPIQGEGGDNHFRPEFLKQLRELADRHEAMLIFDEVQTGVGLTGTMWAFQQLGVTPDIVCFGKKTQICGIMSTRRVDEIEGNVFHVSSRINSTWGGSLADMVRAGRYFEIIQEDNLVENAASTGGFFLEQLHAVAAEFDQISNVRGRGFMLAFDLPDTATRDALRSKLWDIGLASLSCGTRTVRFRPCLTFSRDDVMRAIALLREGLAS
ncbi:MAG: L-lysine 6-transaminase [Acidobacteria bacterium]|nr:L-lysine 6-transaminase [Acidobacteriota bacterium]